MTPKLVTLESHVQGKLCLQSYNGTLTTRGQNWMLTMRIFLRTLLSCALSPLCRMLWTFPKILWGHITSWHLYSSLNHLLVLRVLSIQWVSWSHGKKTTHNPWTRWCRTSDKMRVLCIGGWGVRPAGPPVTGKSFRVVPCVRTCVRAVLGLVRFRANRRGCPFPFPFYRGRPFPFPFCRAGFSLFPCAGKCSLFPCEHHEEMDSNEIKWIHMNSNEITWYQMKSHEFKWAKVN